jgi:NitT/TauT family transport system permease protein
VLVVVAWDAAVRVWRIPRFLVPSPALVLQAFRTHADELSRAVLLTAGEALAGFAASLVVGTLVGCAFSQSAVLRRIGYPCAVFLQTVPIIAIAPLIIVWFGFGFRSVVLVSFVVGLFPVVAAATVGLTQIDAELLELFRQHGATRGQILLKLRLPHAVPYLVTGARIAGGGAVIGAVVGEFFAGYGAGATGLGVLIHEKHGAMKTDELFAAVLCCTALGTSVFGATSLVGATILSRWYDASTGGPR